MSVIEGARLLPRMVQVKTSDSSLVDFLERKLGPLGYYTVERQTRQQIFAGKIGIIVIDIGNKSTSGRPLYKNEIPIVYLTSSTENLISEDDLVDADSDAESGSDAESDSDASESGSDDEAADESGSDDEASGSDDDAERKVVRRSKTSSSGNDKELRAIALQIAETIKDMHTAHSKKELVRKIHGMGDVVVAKAYVRNVFNQSAKFNSEEERQACLEGLKSETLDFIFPDVAKKMPRIRA